MKIDVNDEKLPVGLRLVWRSVQKYLDPEWRAAHPCDWYDEGFRFDLVDWSLEDVTDHTLSPIYREKFDEKIFGRPGHFLYRTVALYAHGTEVLLASIQGTEENGERHHWHLQYAILLPGRGSAAQYRQMVHLPWDLLYI